MNRSVRIALRGYLAPMMALRPLRIGSSVAVLLLASLGFGRVMGFISADALADLRAYVFIPGIPLFATLFGEIALRDGITQRTLLYPLMGPVSRHTLAAVRTLTTGVLLFLGTLILLIAIKLLAGDGWSSFAREVCALLLGCCTYAALAGVLHLLTSRGLVLALGVFGLLDYPLGRLPVALRSMAPSFHVRVLADAQDSFALPFTVAVPAADPLGSTFILIALTVAGTVVAALIFGRRNLPGLC